MATIIKSLTSPEGDTILPRTKSSAITMSDGRTLEAAMKEFNVRCFEVYYTWYYRRYDSLRRIEI